MDHDLKRELLFRFMSHLSGLKSMGRMARQALDSDWEPGLTAAMEGITIELEATHREWFQVKGEE